MPFDLTRAGCAPVIFGNMDVMNAFPGGADGGGGIFLFNMRVERVVMNPEVRHVHGVDDFAAITLAVKNIGLKAIDGFLGQADIHLGRVFRHFADHVRAIFEFFLRPAPAA